MSNISVVIKKLSICISGSSFNELALQPILEQTQYQVPTKHWRIFNF